jgi:two-component sensor histidine kinase
MVKRDPRMEPAASENISNTGHAAIHARTAGIRNILAALRRGLPSRLGLTPYFTNLLLGCAVALLVYAIGQTGLIEKLLNRLLFLLLSAVGTVLSNRHYNAFSLEGVLLDAVTIAIAVAFWTFFRSITARLLFNLLLFAALVPFTVLALDSRGILLNGAPIVLGIIVAIALDAVSDLISNRLRRRIAEQKHEAEFSVIRHLAHNVKPGLQIVRSPLLALREHLGDRGLLDAELSRRMDGSAETVGEALENAIAGLGQISDIIDNTRSLVNREISRDDFREVELQELLEQNVFPLHAGKFAMVVEGGPVRLPLHRESFIEAVNNLLRNAESHGFPEPSDGAEVRFDLRQTRKQVVIDYSNNGRPFPVNLSAGDFLSFGRKGADSCGEGLGGAWVGKVIEAHGGGFEIIRDGQPLHFRITLPKRANG